jgi:hypothetical protein
MVVLCLLGLVSIFFGILDDIESVVAHIHSVDPDIRVVYSIYDYVNVGNGFPAPLALFASAIERRARSIRHFYLVNNLGLLHHTFGYTGAFGRCPVAFPPTCRCSAVTPRDPGIRNSSATRSTPPLRATWRSRSTRSTSSFSPGSDRSSR